jgi:hypothetical protein
MRGGADHERIEIRERVRVSAQCIERPVFVDGRVRVGIIDGEHDERKITEEALVLSQPDLVDQRLRIIFIMGDIGPWTDESENHSVRTYALDICDCSIETGHLSTKVDQNGRGSAPKCRSIQRAATDRENRKAWVRGAGTPGVSGLLLVQPRGSRMIPGRATLRWLGRRERRAAVSPRGRY